jgi:uncharacterized membrane protein YesL
MSDLTIASHNILLAMFTLTGVCTAGLAVPAAAAAA